MKKDFIRHIEQFKGIKALVIGDAILDTYVKGNPDRVCREAPVLVFNVEEQEFQAGGAANTAINVATLGAETYYLTVTGKDQNAKELVDILKKSKVHTDHILKDKARVTIAKKRITAASNILMRIDEGTTTEISEICEKELLAKIELLLPEIDVIILSDYGFGVITPTIINGIEELNGRWKKPIACDARDLKSLKQLNPLVVKPNYEESIKLLNIEKLAFDRPSQVKMFEKQLFELTGAQNVAVTLDAEGVVYFQKGKQPYQTFCIPQENNKAIGAGDTYISALALSLALDAEGEDAAEIAAAAAAVVVKKDGTALCTNSELKAYFNEVPKHMLSHTDLVPVVKELKKNGKKIVFTNGCFDILHKGHITLLNKAREAGDVLIVGVNSDESIKKLKGPGRPINNIEDRITVLAGLQSVDYIVAFEETSPVNLIKTVHPDVFVKGGNYSESTIPEAPLLKKIGCTVTIVPYKEEHATTKMINKIRDKKTEPAIALQEHDFLKEGQLN